jgi:hypothetical protein
MDKIIPTAIIIVLITALFATLAALVTIKSENYQLNQINHQQSLKLKQIQHTNDVLVEICSAQYRK